MNYLLNVKGLGLIVHGYNRFKGSLVREKDLEIIWEDKKTTYFSRANVGAAFIQDGDLYFKVQYGDVYRMLRVKDCQLFYPNDRPIEVVKAKVTVSKEQICQPQ